LRPRRRALDVPVDPAASFAAIEKRNAALTVNPSFANTFGTGLLGDLLPAPDPTETQPAGLLPALPAQPTLAGILGVPVDPASLFAPPPTASQGIDGGLPPQGLLGLSGLNSASPFATRTQAVQPMGYSLGGVSPLAQFGYPLGHNMATFPGQSGLLNAPGAGFAGIAGQGDLSGTAGAPVNEFGRGGFGSKPGTPSGSNQEHIDQAAYVSAAGQPVHAPAAAQRPDSAPAAVPGSPLSADQRSVVAQITEHPAVQTLSPLDRSTLAVIAYSESRLDPNARSGRVRGLFQFQAPTFTSMGGTDISNTSQQIVAAANLLASDKAALSNALHATPTPAQLYMAHMQGRNGSIALLTAPPGETAVDALVKAGVDPVHARRSIIENGGRADMSASDFVNGWYSRFNSYFSLIYPPPQIGSAMPRSPQTSPSPPSPRHGG
jgi:hypothetical protein